MSRDYKGATRKPAAKGRSGSLLIGILIGLLLGLGIALAVAWYINKMPSPFLNRAQPQQGAPQKAAAGKAEDKAAHDGKPRFDFYKILPGNEEAVTDQQFRESQQKASTAAAKEAFFLQAGAFQNAPDADNLKARLALLGIEANIQTTTVAEKGVWHRVRVGPYTAVEELNRARDILKQNGVETTLIKVREASSQSVK